MKYIHDLGLQLTAMLSRFIEHRHDQGAPKRQRIDDWNWHFKGSLEAISNQHDLMVAALRQAGGTEAESIVTPGPGKIADIIFPDERIIVEVKSLTSNRGAMPEVQRRVGEIAMEHGNMIIFGTVPIALDKVAPRAAQRILREIGDRVRKEMRSADKQIESTAKRLSWDNWTGVVAIVAPPTLLRRDVVAWVASDAMKNGKHRAVSSLILASTPFLGPHGLLGDSHVSFCGRTSGDLPVQIKRRFGNAWARLHGQPLQVNDSDPLLEALR